MVSLQENRDIHLLWAERLHGDVVEPVLDHEGRLDRFSGTEGPARAALLLVLHWGHFTRVSPRCKNCKSRARKSKESILDEDENRRNERKRGRDSAYQSNTFGGAATPVAGTNLALGRRGVGARRGIRYLARNSAGLRSASETQE